MDVAIRAIRNEEFGAFVDVVEAAFGQRATPEDEERERRVAEIDRCLVAVEDDSFVAADGAVSLEMTGPGGMAPTAGITAVGVIPSRRRRGLNTALMRRHIDDAHERGEPLAALFASEGGIYGRFGYGLAALSCPIRVKTTRTAFVKGAATYGDVRLFERGDALPAFRSVYERVLPTRPGMMRMDEERFAYHLDESHHHGRERGVWFYAGLEGQAGLDAYVVYRLQQDWTREHRRNAVDVADLQALTPAAYAAMWRYVFDIDLMDVVMAGNRPIDEPLLLLLAEPQRLNLRVADGLWVRLVDVPAALEARRYAAEGSVTIGVHDAFCPWNDGTYVLEAGREGASCRRTEGAPEIELSATDLGAAYLGGMGLGWLWRAGRIAETRTGAVERAGAMFGWDPAAWCPFVF